MVCVTEMRSSAEQRLDAQPFPARLVAFALALFSGMQGLWWTLAAPQQSERNLWQSCNLYLLRDLEKRAPSLASSSPGAEREVCETSVSFTRLLLRRPGSRWEVLRQHRGWQAGAMTHSFTSTGQTCVEHPTHAKLWDRTGSRCEPEAGNEMCKFKAAARDRGRAGSGSQAVAGWEGGGWARCCLLQRQTSQLMKSPPQRMPGKC